jgi:hypothetical protein
MGRWLAAVGIVVGASLGAGTSSAVAASWSLEPIHAPAGSIQAVLSGVSCATASGCEAVGYSVTASGSRVTLVERWNGTAWQIQPSPNAVGASTSELDGVACTSPTSCEAVGDSMLSASDTFRSLAEHWDGTAWRIQPTANPAGANPVYLFGVSCSAATACTAVGEYESHQATLLPLAERWNGTAWALQSVPNPAGAAGTQLNSVACPTATVCSAVGASAGRTLAERWNGTVWSVQATANPATGSEFDLTSVACASSAACTAVGYYYAGGTGGPFPLLAEGWNAGGWHLEHPASAGYYTTFDGVACPTAGACTAVGSAAATMAASYVPLAEGWSGTSWGRQAVPDPRSTAPGAGLTSVSCKSSIACTAVGWVETPTGEFPLAARYA